MSTSFQQIMKWDDDKCRRYLEAQRWPDGPICPKCGEAKPYTINRKSKTKNKVSTFYKCRSCRKQFTATVGTIFEDSHIPLSTWFAAIYLMCASKKGVSAHQIHRMLGVAYRSAWFMCHRIREAMKEDGFLLSGTIEVDETYVGGKGVRGHKVARHERHMTDMEARGENPRTHILRNREHARMKKAAVFGMIERGGRVRSMHVPDVSHKTLKPIMITNIDVKNSRLISDGHKVYKMIRHEMPHDVINHDVEYVRGDVHTQGIENYWSLVKRGIVGTWHHVGVPYLNQYLREFDYRFNRRKTSDEQRFASLVAQVNGKRLTWFCQTPQPENPHA
jgi:transposase-like protein